jgi:hypothetical protein
MSRFDEILEEEWRVDLRDEVAILGKRALRLRVAIDACDDCAAEACTPGGGHLCEAHRLEDEAVLQRAATLEGAW